MLGLGGREGRGGGTQRIWGAGNPLCMTLMTQAWWLHSIIRWSKPIGHTTMGPNPIVSSGSWMIRICLCSSSIVSNVLLLGGGRGCTCSGGAGENSLHLLLHFLCPRNRPRRKYLHYSSIYNCSQENPVRGGNRTKPVRDLYAENYKMLKK